MKLTKNQSCTERDTPLDHENGGCVIGFLTTPDPFASNPVQISGLNIDEYWWDTLEDESDEKTYTDGKDHVVLHNFCLECGHPVNPRFKAEGKDEMSKSKA